MEEHNKTFQEEVNELRRNQENELQSKETDRTKVIAFLEKLGKETDERLGFRNKDIKKKLIRAINKHDDRRVEEIKEMKNFLEMDRRKEEEN